MLPVHAPAAKQKLASCTGKAGQSQARQGQVGSTLAFIAARSIWSSQASRWSSSSPPHSAPASPPPPASPAAAGRRWSASSRALISRSLRGFWCNLR